MVEFFSDAVLRYKLKKRLKIANIRSKEPIRSFNSMAVILPLDRLVDESVFVTIAASLKIPAQNITFVVFSKRKIEQYSTFNFKLIYCSRNDISFSGSFSEEMNSFFEKKWDLLINFFSDRSVFPEFISSCCTSKLRLGFSKANHDINDVLLDVNPFDNEVFIAEATNYLRAFIK